MVVGAGFLLLIIGGITSSVNSCVICFVLLIIYLISCIHVIGAYIGVPGPETAQGLYIALSISSACYLSTKILYV